MSAKAKAKVADQLQAIEDASRDELLIGWHQHFGQSPPKNISTLLLRRAVAYKVQERAYGGLRPQTYRYLRQVVVGEEAKPKTNAIPAPVELLPGTQLIREWNGKSYEVQMVAPNQFIMDGQVYGSLSEIARLITGAHWSGPRFFGLVKVKSK